MMRRFAALIIGMVFTVIASGCASKSGGAATSQSTEREKGQTYVVWVRSDAIPVTRVVSAPLETVWSTLPQAFTDLGYSGGPAMHARERVFLTTSLTVRGRLYDGEMNSSYLDCGRTPASQLAADFYAINFAILARVTPQDGGTRVDVVIDGTARDRGQSTNAVFCTGTGRIERALLDRLEARLNRPPE